MSLGALSNTEVSSSVRSYSFGYLLGRGGYSEVYSAKGNDGISYAVKVIDKSSLGSAKRQQNIIREVEITRKIQHPNVLTLVEVMEDTQRLYLITPYMAGGELFNKIVARGHFTEADATKTVRQILEGMKYLHGVGICHRDLKPENILCSAEEDFSVVISDFGFSKLFGHGELMVTACGTLQYAAPEVFKARQYTEACDMWTVGVITYVILTGQFPFDGTYDDLVMKISQANYCRYNLTAVGVSSTACDFLEKLLVVNPAARMTAAQALLHPWISSFTPTSSLQHSVDRLTQAAQSRQIYM